MATLRSSMERSDPMREFPRIDPWRKTAGRIGLAVIGAAGLTASGAAAQDRPKHMILAGISSATVAPGGLAFASLSGTNNAANDKTDGSLALGFGVGSAEDGVGLQFTAQITSLTDSFGDSGFIAVKASRRIGGDIPLYVGLQVDHLLNWGDADDVDVSGKLSLTYFTAFTAGGQSFPLMLTVGGGNKISDLGQEPGFYAGIGVGLTEHIGTSLAYSGDYFELGLGVKASDNLLLTATLEDVFDQEDEQRVNFSVTYTWRNMFGG